MLNPNCYLTGIDKMHFNYFLKILTERTIKNGMIIIHTYTHIYIYIYIYISSYAISTDIPDPLSPPLLLFIASGRSSGLHPRILTKLLYVGSSWSSCFLLGHVQGVYRSTSLMSSYLLLQQCPACLVRLTIYIYMGGGHITCKTQSLTCEFDSH